MESSGTAKEEDFSDLLLKAKEAHVYTLMFHLDQSLRIEGYKAGLKLWEVHLKNIIRLFDACVGICNIMKFEPKVGIHKRREYWDYDYVFELVSEVFSRASEVTNTEILDACHEFRGKVLGILTDLAE